MTSGRSALMNFATRLMRNRTELMFQVEMVRRMVVIWGSSRAKRSDLAPLAQRLWLRLLRFARNDESRSPRIGPVRIGDFEHRRIGLLGGVEIVDRHGGVVALRVGDGPLPQLQILG